MKTNKINSGRMDRCNSTGADGLDRFSCRAAIKASAAVAAALGMIVGLSPGAIANPIESANVAQAASDEGAVDIEIDSSISRDYEPAVVYLHDPITHELEPQSVLVVEDQPVAGAVDQIMQSYQGQDIGIEGYDVTVDSVAHEAAIDFNIDNPRGADAFQSLSSTSQYSLFEAIRETLLTQPMYDIDNVIFLANGTAFDI